MRDRLGLTKDRLGNSRWWNQPIKNETQNRYRRFVTLPGSELKTRFSESQAKFAATLRDALKTHYGELDDR